MSIKKDLEAVNKRLTKRILKGAGISPVETISNSMTTGSHSILWRPNNYRRKVQAVYSRNSTIRKLRSAIGSFDTKRKVQPFSTPNNSTIGKGKSAISAIDTTKKLKINSHNKLINFGFKGITFQFGKKTITAIYSQNTDTHKKMTYHIKTDSLGETSKVVTEKVSDIKKEMDSKLKELCKILKIKLHNKIEWDRYEDWIKGEEFIDQIPIDTIIHDTHFKKVYPEGIEFIKGGKDDKIGAGVKLNTYITNRAIEDIAPKIAEEISDIKEYIKSDNDKLSEILKITHQELQTMIKAQTNTQEQLTTLIQALTPIKMPTTKLKQPKLSAPDYIN